MLIGPLLSYQYDQATRLVRDGRGGTLAYDPVGNPTTLTGTPGLLGTLTGATTTTQTFDETDQLTGVKSSGLLGTTWSFRYDESGRRLAQSSKHLGLSTGTVSYLWDQAGRLLDVNDSAARVAGDYTYDDTGLRKTQAELQLVPNGWDRSGELPLMLTDGLAAYVYGPDGLPVWSIKASLLTSVYHQDVQGSTRALTSATGGLPLATYSYDAYGALRGNVKVAATLNPFLYRGQYTDAGTGLIYLRARYYDPQTGQFLSRDPLEDDTLDAYVYAGADPINQSDPSGQLSWRDVSNFAAGFGDTVSFGATREVRKLLGSDDNVDFCSGAYSGGEIAGGVAGVATGGSGALRTGANTLRGRGWVWRGGEWQNADRSVRVAPFGNEPFSSTMKNGNTNEWYRRLPHYHRRKLDSDGQTLPGQGIGRHRPGQSSQHDRDFTDRF